MQSTSTIAKQVSNQASSGEKYQFYVPSSNPARRETYKAAFFYLNGSTHYLIVFKKLQFQGCVLGAHIPNSASLSPPPFVILSPLPIAA